MQEIPQKQRGWHCAEPDVATHILSCTPPTSSAVRRSRRGAEKLQQPLNVALFVLRQRLALHAKGRVRQRSAAGGRHQPRHRDSHPRLCGIQRIAHPHLKDTRVDRELQESLDGRPSPRSPSTDNWGGMGRLGTSFGCAMLCTCPSASFTSPTPVHSEWTESGRLAADQN